MNDLIRSGVYTAMGSLVLARKKFEELLEELIQNNELTQDEGQRLVHEWIHRAEDLRNDLEKRMNGAVDESLLKLNLPTRQEFELKFSEWRDRLNQFRPGSLFGHQGREKPAVQ
jgi:polyhydroxyalkanoate synthesis regulator phasin